MTRTEATMLKPLVNNPLAWNILDTYLSLCYNNKQKELERLVPIEEIYRAQGYIQALRHVLDLKANANVTET